MITSVWFLGTPSGIRIEVTTHRLHRISGHHRSRVDGIKTSIVVVSLGDKCSEDTTIPTQFSLTCSGERIIQEHTCVFGEKFFHEIKRIIFI